MFGVHHLRFAGLVTVVSIPSFAWSNRCVIHQFKEMLSVACNDCQLFTVLAQGVKLICEGGLEFLASDVGKLRFSNEGFGFGTDEFLLKHNDLGRIGFLVLELGDLIGDFLLACYLSASYSTYDDGPNSRSRLGWTDASILRMLLIVTLY